MTYRPAKRTSFGPPLKSWVLPVVYLIIAMAFLAVVTQAHATVSDSWLHRYIVEQDPRRIVGSQTLAWVFFLGGVASVARAAMRGVVVSRGGVEAREVFALGFPRVKRYSWTEIQAIIFEKNNTAVELWNGEQVWLPLVGHVDALQGILAHVAEARAIPLRVREPVSSDELDQDS